LRTADAKLLQNSGGPRPDPLIDLESGSLTVKRQHHATADQLFHEAQQVITVKKIERLDTIEVRFCEI
jgi:hypothetical protein